MTKPARYGVVVADDDVSVCDALGSLIDDHPDLELLGTAHSGTEAVELVGRLHPHLVVADVMMPAGGVEAIHAVHAVAPDTVVAMFTASRNRRLRASLIEEGAVAVFSKGDSIDLAEALASLVVNARGEAERSEPE